MTESYSRPPEKLVLRLILLVIICASCALALARTGFSTHQAVSTAVLASAILGTLFFWEFRLAVVFIGTSVLFLTRTLDIEHLILHSSLDVILFLVGMMILVAAMDELGLFAWLTFVAVHQKRASGQMIMFQLCVLSALLACAVDEVTSIVLMIAVIFQLCMRLRVNPVPFVIMSVICTNIGSTGTILGNPVGILIGLRAGLTFEDFIVKAFPIMVVLLFVSWLILSFWYRREIREFDVRLKECLAQEACSPALPAPRLSVSAIILFAAPITMIALHRRFEELFHLQKNTVLVLVPLTCAGIVMLWKKGRTRDYVEKHVDWSTLLFFLFLFILAETLASTGVAEKVAGGIVSLAGGKTLALVALIIIFSGVLSAFLDNVVVVATFIPVISSIGSAGVEISPLWWALLFGGCLGGNITMIGSTANICAIGMLEKSQHKVIKFLDWLKIGLLIGVITMILAAVGIFLLSM
jgi:Na+/H+ antiporter NhaD/arsenite permease-like protein